MDFYSLLKKNQELKIVIVPHGLIEFRPLSKNRIFYASSRIRILSNTKFESLQTQDPQESNSMSPCELGLLKDSVYVGSPKTQNFEKSNSGDPTGSVSVKSWVRLQFGSLFLVSITRV